jgi:hypothetical protein
MAIDDTFSPQNGEGDNDIRVIFLSIQNLTPHPSPERRGEQNLAIITRSARLAVPTGHSFIITDLRWEM